MEDQADIFLPTHERIGKFISRLPTLSREQIPLDDSCPICLMSFDAICDQRQLSTDKLADIVNGDVDLHGVTQLTGCGHIFCRMDLIEWIKGRHGTCPACRHTFLHILPLDSDNESSDGDYVPGEEEEEEDDGFLDTDGFTDMDTEFDVDGEMDLGLEGFWGVTDDEFEDADENMDSADLDPANWGLTDEEGSESMSEEDLFVDGVELSQHEDEAGVYEDDAYLSAPEGDEAEEPK